MKTAYRKWLSEKLQRLRAAKTQTRFDVAFRLGINESTYRAYEDGRSEPPLFVFKNICSLYNLSADQFLKDSPASQVQNFC